MSSVEQVRYTLTRILVSITNVRQEDISGDETLDMLGIDSAGAVALASQIEVQFEILIDPQDVAGDATIRELVQLIVSRADLP